MKLVGGEEEENSLFVDMYHERTTTSEKETYDHVVTRHTSGPVRSVPFRSCTIIDDHTPRDDEIYAIGLYERE